MEQSLLEPINRLVGNKKTSQIISYFVFISGRDPSKVEQLSKIIHDAIDNSNAYGTLDNIAKEGEKMLWAIDHHLKITLNRLVEVDLEWLVGQPPYILPEERKSDRVVGREYLGEKTYAILLDYLWSLTAKSVASNIGHLVVSGRDNAAVYFRQSIEKIISEASEGDRESVIDQLEDIEQRLQGRVSVTLWDRIIAREPKSRNDYVEAMRLFGEDLYDSIVLLMELNEEQSYNLMKIPQDDVIRLRSEVENLGEIDIEKIAKILGGIDRSVTDSVVEEIQAVNDPLEEYYQAGQGMLESITSPGGNDRIPILVDKLDRSIGGVNSVDIAIYLGKLSVDDYDRSREELRAIVRDVDTSSLDQLYERARLGTDIRVNLEQSLIPSMSHREGDPAEELDQLFTEGDNRLKAYRDKLISLIGEQGYRNIAVNVGDKSLGTNPRYGLIVKIISAIDRALNREDTDVVLQYYSNQGRELIETFNHLITKSSEDSVGSRTPLALVRLSRQ